ncbi:MAG: hypothetical protein ACOY82_11600 [Pseudomonadota bacterium]
MLGACVVASLAGCGDSVGGTDRAGKALLATDIYGCPDLTGTYAFPPPGEKGVSYAGSMLEEFPIEWGNRVPANQIRAVSVRRIRPGAFEFRFQVQDARVMQHLALIREFYKPRYREWYHLLREPERSAYIARHGAENHARRVRELGPPAEIVREVRSGTDAACRDGWLELPRQYIDRPIRLTLGEDRSILGESGELSTYDIPIWCGDGCKDLKIPTGTYTGTLRWPRDDAQRPWRAEDAATRVVFERPIDEIEAEQRARTETQRRSDEKRFLPAGAIRDRLQAIAPAGTTVDGVTVEGGKVHVRYTAPTAEMDGLLERVAAAGGIGVAQAPQEVQRIVTSGRFRVRSVEFVLTDSPLVLRDARGTDSSSAPAVVQAGDGSSDAPASSMLSLSAADAPSTGAASGRSPAATAAPPAPQTPPAGTADPLAIQRRVAPLFPAGCRIVDVRYNGKLVVLKGQAEQHGCVSAGLRALDDAGSRPELQSIEGDARGGYGFRISIRPSSLTRR